MHMVKAEAVDTSKWSSQCISISLLNWIGLTSLPPCSSRLTLTSQLILLAAIRQVFCSPHALKSVGPSQSPGKVESATSSAATFRVKAGPALYQAPSLSFHLPHFTPFPLAAPAGRYSSPRLVQISALQDKAQGV